MTDLYSNILRAFCLPPEKLKDFLYTETEGLTFFNRDSEDEGTPLKEKALMELFCDASDIIGFSEAQLQKINEMLWLCELSVGFIDQANYAWKISDTTSEQFWAIMKRYSLNLLEECQKNTTPPNLTFLDLLKAYEFEARKT